ncbi:MAG: DNA alkylation repair protein [Anaerolineales bacterium]|nr:DNA alkylation repair protein [Anaerolineales bacterium]MCW5855172.1 DNA alkylation repair protein [Anaerolineales bacterium]
MPTIELGRLKQEAALLSQHFSDPPGYLRELERLLEAYSMPVNRLGEVRGLRPVLKTYEVPTPLLRQLQLEMSQLAEEDPATALQVADGLWARRSIETRQLAARLLGATPAEAHEVTARLAAWAEENQEPWLAPELAQAGTQGLQKQHAEALITWAGQLLAGGHSRQQSLALAALQHLLQGPGYANLPAIYTLLEAPVRSADRKIRPDLADLLSELGRQSPKETEYFLQQALQQPDLDPGCRWIARQVYKVLPAVSQARLRPLL